MLRAQTINPETAELLAAGMQQLVGVLGVVIGLYGDHGDKGKALASSSTSIAWS